MLPDLVEAEYIAEYKVKLKFADGTEGIVDLSNELEGAIFKPLKEINFFKKFIVRKDFGTLEWENGADFAPEFLYESAKKGGQPTARFDAR